MQNFSSAPLSFFLSFFDEEEGAKHSLSSLAFLIRQSWEIGSDLTLAEISCTFFDHLEIVSINMRGTDRNLAIPLNRCQTYCNAHWLCLWEPDTTFQFHSLWFCFPLSLISYQMHVHSIKKKITNTYSMSSLQVYIRTEWQVWACDVLIRKAVPTCREMAIWLVFLEKFLR